MAIPILKSADLARSLEFYVGTLGAQLLWRDETTTDPGYLAVKWRNHELHLSSHSGDGAWGTHVYFEVDDVDELFASLHAAGWSPPPEDRGPVFLGPTDQTWGTRELYVLDPDRNCLRFGSIKRG